MSRETAAGGMPELALFNELRQAFDNLPHSDADDESVDYDNDVILDDDDSITTMPVRESSDTDIYDGSASRPEADRHYHPTPEALAAPEIASSTTIMT